MTEFQSTLNVTRVEPRADRYLIFCSIPEQNESYSFYYPVRVAYRGSFTLPGITANSMYDTAVAARRPAEHITVK